MMTTAARISVFSAALCIGVWSGLHAQGVSSGTIIAPERIQEVSSDAVPAPERIRNSRVALPTSCGEASTVGLDAQTGYSFVGKTKIGSDCFAAFVETIPVDTAGYGEGSTDVFNSSGRLVTRFSAIKVPGSEWKIVEYVRLPGNGDREESQRQLSAKEWDHHAEPTGENKWQAETITKVLSNSMMSPQSKQ